jgi:hypothetical protein
MRILEVMTKFVASVSLLLLGSQAPPAPESRPAPPRAGLSWQEADTLARKIQEVEELKRTGKPVPRQTVQVTEAQLNSYLNLTLGTRTLKGVQDLDVRFERERLAAHALVDLDRLPIKGSLGFFGNLLGGSVPVELRGRMPNRDGQGTIDVEELRLSGYSMPKSVLAQIVSASTKSSENPSGFDINAPFKLPYDVRSVRFEPGKAVVEF